MIDYVEWGTQFAVEYSYGDEEFFESLDETFTQVVKTLQKSEQAVIDRFLPRLKTVVQKAAGIGWGYYDSIYDTLADAFPEA